LAAALSVLFIMRPHVPREREVELRLQEPLTVTGVDVAWCRSSGDDRSSDPTDEPLGGASFRFAPGTAPQNIKHHVRLPDGSYQVDLVVQRGEHADSIRRTVVLDEADRIMLPLR